MKSVWEILKETARQWYSDQAPRHGAVLAFYTVFSLSPLLVIVVSIARFVFGDEAPQQIFEQIRGLIGEEGGKALASVLAKPREAGEGVLASLVAVGTLLIGSTVVFVELQDALNSMWNVQTKPGRGLRSFVRNRLLSFAMILAIGFLLLVSLVVSAAVSAFGKWISQFAPGLDFLWQSLNFLLALGIITVLFALIYKYLPDVRISWHDVWIGAFITSFLFNSGKFLLGVYLANNTLASAYGAAASLVFILLWVYYSSQILFFGAEFTQVYANRYGSHVRPAEYAEFAHGESKPEKVKSEEQERRKGIETFI